MEAKNDAHVRPDKVSATEELRRAEEARRRREQGEQTEITKPANPIGVRTK